MVCSIRLHVCVRMNCNSNGGMFKIKMDRNLRRVYLQTSLIPFPSISKLLELVIALYKNIILISLRYIIPQRILQTLLIMSNLMQNN